MADTVSGSYGKVIAGREFLLPLQSQIYLIVAHTGGVCLYDAVYIAVAVDNRYRLVVRSPKIRHVGTRRKPLEYVPSETDEGLMEATRTVMVFGGCGNCRLLGRTDFRTARIAVAYIRERHNTHTDTYFRHQAEQRDSILEIGIVGIELPSALFKICYLTGQTDIHYHCQRVDGRI